ncbi:MAG: hypothetical protein EAZ97_07260 [Bacteroidetes bacterium]|nr:MAG: hypothetical protein EAZ97_07260 [Bacteroidota bacterium]
MEENLRELEKKIQVLRKEYLQMQANLQKANSRIEELNAKVEEQEVRLQEQEQQEHIDKIADTLEINGLKSAELQPVLDEYIQKIDHCIAFLSTQL